MTQDRIVNRAELARELRLRSPAYVNKLKADGRVVEAPGRKGYFLLEATRARVEATKDPSKAHVAARHAEGRGEPLSAPTPPAPAQEPAAAEPEAVTANPVYADARARREAAEASIRELELAKRRGQILERADVEAAAESIATALCARIDAVPHVWASQFIGLADEARSHAILAEAMLILRRELVKELRAMAEPPA